VSTSKTSSSTRRRPAAGSGSGAGHLTKGERTRSRLVQVAAQVFAERGCAATTFADLIQAAGVSKGAFYFHFSSKEELVLAVLVQTKNGWLETVHDRLSDAPDAAAALHGLAEAVLALYLDDPVGWNVAALARELLTAPNTSPQLREQASEVTRRWVEAVAELISAAQAEGSVSREVDAVALARLLCAAVDGSRDLVDALDAPEHRREAFASQIRVLADLLERALFTGAEPGRGPQHPSGSAHEP
jgi:AcrR family transcriptional regulator